MQEITQDTSIKAPDEIIARQHMRNSIMELLGCLEPRERRVLMLRYGFEDGRCRSLGEIANICCVSKEWTRKIEKFAMARIRRENTRRELI